MEQKIQDNSDQTFLMMECGRIDLKNPVDRAFMLMGKTKAGKTTSMHYMMHHSLIGMQLETYSPVIYKLDAGGLNAQQARIGYHQSRSQTQIPNYFQTKLDNQNYCAIDLPGFSDTYGCFRAVSNRYFTHKAFSQVKKIKFIIVIAFIDMLKAAQGLIKSFTYFFQSFNDINSVLPDILPSISLLFTGVPKEFDDKGIIQKYSKLEQKFPSIYTKAYKTLKQSLIKNKQVFLFRQAELGKAADVENDLLSRINKSSKQWWERNIDNEGKVDNSQIKITLADFKDKDQQTFMKQLTLFSKFIGQKLKLIIKQENGLTQVIHQFISECEKNTQYSLSNKVNKFLSENEEKIRKKDKQYVALYLKYKNKRKETQQKQFAEINEESSVAASRQITPRYEKIRVIMEINEIVREIIKIDIQRDIKTVDKFLQSTKDILKIFMSLLGNKSQFRSYAYTIYSSLEIMRQIYFLIFNTTHQLGYHREGRVLPLQFQDIYLNFPTDFKRFFNNIFSNKTNPYMLMTNFILSLDTSTSYSNLKAYDILINFLANAKVSIKKQNNESKNKIEKEDQLIDKLNQIISQLQSKKLESQVYNEKELNIGHLLEYSQNIHKKIVEQEEQPLKLNHKWEDNLCLNFKNNQLIAYQLKKQNMKVALQIYESLHDAHQVLQYYSNEQHNMKYDPKNQDSKQKMLLFLIDYMKKAYKYCRLQLAIEKAQKAYSIAQLLGDKAKIEKIGKFLNKICPVSYDESSGSDNQGLEQSKREYFEMMGNGLFRVELSQEVTEAVKSISKKQSPVKRIKSPPPANKKKSQLQ